MNDSGNPGAAAAAAWEAAMRRGDFASAWAVSDAVLAARDPATRDDPALPYHLRWVWDGQPLDGCQVLVRCYHGLGDTLQFCRYLAPLRARGAHVTLEVQPELAPLLRGMAADVHPFDPAHPLPPGERTIEIMELAHALRLAPALDAYLRATPLPVGAGRVGVCWQAGGWDMSRSIPVEALRPLRRRAPLVSLQRGAAAAEWAMLGAVDPLDGSMDVVAMAGLIAGLDAVMTVDTMVAHLAGALGRPTVVLLKQGADWRWGEQATCSWYGSARLVRQRVAGSWDGVAIAAVATLQDIVRSV